MHTVTQSPDRKQGLLLALALCSLGGFPIGGGNEWFDRILWNPVQRQKLRAVISHKVFTKHSSIPPSPQPLPLPRAQLFGRGEEWKLARGKATLFPRA